MLLYLGLYALMLLIAGIVAAVRAPYSHWSIAAAAVSLQCSLRYYAHKFGFYRTGYVWGYIPRY